jgi:hypothetical protein
MSVKQLPYQFTNSVLLRFRCCFAISGYGLFCEDLFRNLVLLRVTSETAFGWSLTAWTHCRRPSSLSLGIVKFSCRLLGYHTIDSKLQKTKGKRVLVFLFSCVRSPSVQLSRLGYLIVSDVDLAVRL